MDYQISQQVVVRRRLRSHAATSELRVGTILALAGDGNQAVVSIPSPGGRVVRETVDVTMLEPVSQRFRRASVQFNPAFRQIGGWKPVQ